MMRGDRFLIGIGVLLLPVLADSQPATSEGFVSAASIISGLCAICIILVGIWSRKQDRDIERAQRTADDATRNVGELERQILRTYRPSTEIVESFKSALGPLISAMNTTNRRLHVIEEMIRTGSRFIDPTRLPDEDVIQPYERKR